ncbi:3'(2'),5'-bisphosphate nucleotidase [Limimonas halophila]|uniref:3'(2'),5'-bisphosphate nucleotidase CysQ n=1 Tax=Limimonas halophila TaxID=1082479 RepID=A0A1G7QN44_9PROT|nr:3'(2'),5'-bisphosphate nucleotidase CysQ [Limimonas halophila]SDF99961.1 3'(2'),5'-bisphosphate nucleotidase [Limimonas halophila]
MTEDLTPERMNELVDLVRRLAGRAGQATLVYYGADADMGVQEKSDESPLTKADLAADRIIGEELKQATPDIPVVSEEGVEQHGAPAVDRLFWLVDPLDGTKEFIEQNGEFTVNIALIKDGQPVLGIVYAPALNRTWLGARLQSGEAHALFIDDGAEPEEIAARTPPAEGLTVVASRRHGDPETLKAFLGGKPVAETKNAGSSIKFCLVASGEADLYPRFGRTMEWDTAAGHAVLAAAGGRVETTDGQPFTYGKPDFANPEFVAYGA